MTVATKSMPLFVREPIPNPIVEASSIPKAASGTDTDASQLSAAVARGDAAAFQQVYEKYHARLLRFAVVLARGDELLARDAVQSAFVTAAAKLRRVESEDHLWNWLARVARQHLAKAWRRQRQDTTVVVVAQLPEFQDGVEPDSWLEECLDSGLLALAADEQQMIEWFYFDGLSHKEIAVRLDTTPKAVSSQLERSRAKLRSLIKRRLSHET
ncbi:MAG: sigma-70 family RNA polymerase sigma factor [Verrucomicrobiota bacterium]|jgi:RNA polymerase sigma-70 factor (ECF subfamily)